MPKFHILQYLGQLAYLLQQSDGGGLSTVKPSDRGLELKLSSIAWELHLIKLNQEQSCWKIHNILFLKIPFSLIVCLHVEKG